MSWEKFREMEKDVLMENIMHVHGQMLEDFADISESDQAEMLTRFNPLLRTMLMYYEAMLEETKKILSNAKTI